MEANTQNTNTDQGKRMRGPNYPSIDLDRSITIAQSLFEKYKKTSVAFEVAMKALNISPKSSGGLRITAALASYGLIEVEGVGNAKQIKISDLAYQIIADKRAISSERDIAIRESALSPVMFKKIWEEYPENLPPKDVLEYDLTFKYRFNPSSTSDFINVFTKTMEYAKVYEYDIIGGENSITQEQDMTNITDKTIEKPSVKAPPMFSGNEKEIANYPIKGGTVRLLASAPITQKSIEKLIKQLELSKDDFPLEEEQLEN